MSNFQLTTGNLGGFGTEKQQNFEAGQSLFELVVAVAVSALIISALVSLATLSIGNSIFSRNKALAANYAQEATEWLRGQRDNNADTFFDKALKNTNQPGGGYCLASLTSLASLKLVSNIATSTNCSLTENSTFTRYVILTSSNQSGKTVVRADVVVSWSDARGFHEITSATNFTDWRER
jgi:type II secretory pathway pseudopilin PulG